MNPESAVPLVTAGGVAVPKVKLLLGASAGFDPGFGVSQATHLVFSGSFRTIQASHSHLLEPVSLNALPKPPAEVEPLPTAAGVAGLVRASKQLPDFNSGTTEPLFRASKQLPLFSGKGVVEELGVTAAGTAAFGLAISGLNWNPPSFREAATGALTAPIGSGSLNRKSFLGLELETAAELADTSNFAGDENLYTLLFLALTES